MNTDLLRINTDNRCLSVFISGSGNKQPVATGEKQQMNIDSDQINTDPNDPIFDKEMEELSHLVIGAAYEVSNTLGIGFLEKVYENALAHEIRLRGHKAEQQKELEIDFKGEIVGKYSPDIVVDNKLIVELKVAREFDENHLAQCLNYLTATGFRICLLLNFYHKRIQIKRIVM